MVQEVLLCFGQIHQLETAVPATRTNGKKALILRAFYARKMSALNKKMHKWDAPLQPWINRFTFQR
jgi:hypothetical protein